MQGYERRATQCEKVANLFGNSKKKKLLMQRSQQLKINITIFFIRIYDYHKQMEEKSRDCTGPKNIGYSIFRWFCVSLFIMNDSDCTTIRSDIPDSFTTIKFELR